MPRSSPLALSGEASSSRSMASAASRGIEVNASSCCCIESSSRTGTPRARASLTSATSIGGPACGPVRAEAFPLAAMACTVLSAANQGCSRSSTAGDEVGSRCWSRAQSAGDNMRWSDAPGGSMPVCTATAPSARARAGSLKSIST
jgi:hypothetical protein